MLTRQGRVDNARHFVGRRLAQKKRGFKMRWTTGWGRYAAGAMCILVELG
jgi:hypothetical protein